MKDSLKQSIQGNHNLLSEVFWVTGNFLIIVAVLKIIMPLISFFERLPGHFINDFFFTLLRKKSSCMQVAINADNYMESNCLLHLMCFNYSIFLIHLSLLKRVRHKELKNISDKFLARWVRRDLGIKTAEKTKIRYSKLNITIHKLNIIVDGWPWECQTLSVIKLLKS